MTDMRDIIAKAIPEFDPNVNPIGRYEMADLILSSPEMLEMRKWMKWAYHASGRRWVVEPPLPHAVMMWMEV